MMDHLKEDFLWVEKYRPRCLDDTILPETLKQTFKTFVDQKNIPNLLLSGTSGIGKTTVARAMLEELDCDYVIINGSMSGNIDTLRNDIKQFASAMSLQGTRKYVILDEADFLNANSFQPALRNFMEEYSRNCGFILTCNYQGRILDAIHSRCSVIEFKIPSRDKSKLAAQFIKRVCHILTLERVTFDTAVLAAVVKKYFPDWRRVLNELQRYAAQTEGKIDSGILVDLTKTSIDQLLGFMKDKDFTNVRKWVAENVDMSPTELFRKLYDAATEHVTPSSIPVLILTLAKYQYQAGHVADQEINNAACMVEIMAEVTFK